MTNLIKKIQDNLPELFGIAISAGQAINAIYKQDFNVNYKDDNSPLTQADLNANDIIVKHLGLLFDFPVISEENCKEFPFNKRKDLETYWCVDPLDGTKEFVNKTGEFSVNIALMHNNKPIFGLIYAPVTSLMYYGLKGVGSFKIENILQPFNKAVKINVRKQSESYKILASRTYGNNPPSLALVKRLEKINPVEVSHMGSSLKMCLIAEGKADLYPRFGGTCEWDTSAAEIILIEAGGGILSVPSLSVLEYNKPREDFENPHFFAYGQFLDEYFDEQYVFSCRLES